VASQPNKSTEKYIENNVGQDSPSRTQPWVSCFGASLPSFVQPSATYYEVWSSQPQQKAPLSAVTKCALIYGACPCFALSPHQSSAPVLLAYCPSFNSSASVIDNVASCVVQSPAAVGKWQPDQANIEYEPQPRPPRFRASTTYLPGPGLNPASRFTARM
jgi:hypothetical protein